MDASHGHRRFPLSFPNPWNKTVWAPQNYDHSYLGPIPLRKAVEQSRNVPAVRTLQAVGVEAGIEYARKLGLQRRAPPVPPHRTRRGRGHPRRR